MADAMIEKVLDARSRAKAQAKQGKEENRRRITDELRVLGFDPGRLRINWRWGGLRYPGVQGCFVIRQGYLFQVTDGGRWCHRVDKAEDVRLKKGLRIWYWVSSKVKWGRKRDLQSVEQEVEFWMKR